ATPAVGPTLQQRRTLAPLRAAYRLDGGLVDGQDVVAIDSHAWQAVSLGDPVDVVARSPLQQLHVARVEIVLADEDDRQLVKRCEIEGLMKVTFLGRAVTKKRHGDSSVAAQLRRKRGADGQRDRCRH